MEDGGRKVNDAVFRHEKEGNIACSFMTADRPGAPYGDSRLPPHFRPPGSDINTVPGLQHPTMGLARPQGGPPPPMVRSINWISKCSDI